MLISTSPIHPKSYSHPIARRTIPSVQNPFVNKSVTTYTYLIYLKGSSIVSKRHVVHCTIKVYAILKYTLCINSWPYSYNMDIEVMGWGVMIPPWLAERVHVAVSGTAAQTINFVKSPKNLKLKWNHSLDFCKRKAWYPARWLHFMPEMYSRSC